MTIIGASPRWAFIQLGYNPRELKDSQAPPGGGAAEQWVRQRYANEVSVYRSKAGHQKIGLVVVIDADKQTVDDRHKQLSSGLGEAGLLERGPGERIVIWVPKRHIETWVADLLGHAANEEDDYKKHVRGGDYQRAAAGFAERYQGRNSRPAGLLPSMARAFDETDRLPA